MPFGWAAAAVGVAAAASSYEKNKSAKQAANAAQTGIAGAKQDVATAAGNATNLLQPIVTNANAQYPGVSSTIAGMQGTLPGVLDAQGQMLGQGGQAIAGANTMQGALPGAVGAASNMLGQGGAAVAGANAAQSNWGGANAGIAGLQGNLPGASQGAAQGAGLLGQGASALQGQQGTLNVGQFMDPSMAFQLKTGQDAIQGSAAARGMLNSGATLKDLTAYGTGLASQNYNTAVQQAMANRAQQTGIGQTLLSAGQTGVGQQAQLGTTGVNLGANVAQGGQAAAQSMYTGGAQLANNLGQAGQAANQNMYTGGTQLGAGLATTGLQGGQGLYNTGVTAQTNMANIATGLGQDQAALDQTSGNVEASRLAGQRNPLMQGVETGLNAWGGYMLGGGGSGGGSLGSDPKLKEGERPISGAEIDAFMASADPTSFKYTKKAQADGAPPGRRAGVMATDIEKSKIGKGLVSKDKAGMKQIDVPQSVGALIAVAADQHKRLKQLEKKS